MPFQIVREQLAYNKADAIVTPVYPAKTNFLFGPRVGSVTVSPAGAPNKYALRVVCASESRDAALWKRCYVQCLKAAKRKKLSCVAMPLLTGPAQGFAPEQAMKIAMDAIRDFGAEDRMQIYLMVPGSETFRISKPRNQALSDYIDRHYITLPQWDFTPFSSEEDRFQTAAPMPCPDEETSCPIQAAPSLVEKRKTRLQSPRPMPYPQKVKKGLEEYVRCPDAGFSETLLNLIDKTGKKDSEIYNKANVSRQHFSKIRNNPDYKPTKPTAIAFAIALELDLEQTKDLIGRAGYALTASSKFDLIIMYFIENQNYDLFDINEALFEFDQSLLGA